MIPVNFKRDDRCYGCNTNSIECYDYNGRPMGFSRIINLSSNGREVDLKKSISYMKCTKCGTRYTPQWENGRSLPRPMNTDIGLSIFMKNFGG